MSRAAIFGWGLVAPNSANVEEFARNLDRAESWLSPFNGFGPDNFLVGQPKFDFTDYQEWIEKRFPPSRVRQLTDKMDPTTLYAVGSFIQSLSQNPGLEEALQELGPAAHVYVGNALGAYPTVYRTSVEHYRAQRRWNRFWSAPERNAAYAAFLAKDGDVPVQNPETIVDPDAREEAEDAWFAYWAARADGLSDYLAQLREIEALRVEGDVETGKLKVIREKRKRLALLHDKWGTPEPPWNRVSANVLWNIPNTPASQISMLGRIKGFAFAPVAACSTFGVGLKLALDAIARGEAKMVVVGSADPPPHPMTVGAFYNARVLAADGDLSKPLSGLKGTHVAGGSCIWVVGDLEYGLSKGFKPLGLEPLSVGVSADADHIITPSEEGPRSAMRQALRVAGVNPEDVGSWDLHATATPGDYLELENLQTVLPRSVLVTARKGTFGHGMGVGGGWELTAQYLGCARGRLYPTPLSKRDLHESIQQLNQELVFDEPVDLPPASVGKLSMGVGGINACVISRPWNT